MKNKFFIIIVICSLFLGINKVQAATNQCTLQDSNSWKYETTLAGRVAQNTIDEKKYDHNLCCTDPNGTVVCDFYSTVKTSTSGGETGGTTEGGSSGGTVDYCNGLNSTFVFIGHIVRLAKILIPIVIIGFGMIDFFKAVTGSKDDEIKKSVKSLIFRCIAGVCIFFLPAIISLVFSWVDGWSSNYEGTTKSCFNCIWDVGSCSK